MRYKRAVEKLRLLAERCERMKGWPPDSDPWLVAMYTFGPVLDGTDPLDGVHVVGVIRVPPEEARWGSEPHGSEWAADILRLSKGGYEYWWRSYQDPVWNHGLGRYPENELWEAVEGYLDLLDASRKK